jgi:hypothetical protein
MSADNINAPAFPGSEKNGDGSHYYSHPGLTKREHFAGLALQAMGTWVPEYNAAATSSAGLEARANWAVRQADALLAELAKGGDA